MSIGLAGWLGLESPQGIGQVSSGPLCEKKSKVTKLNVCGNKTMPQLKLLNKKRTRKLA